MSKNAKEGLSLAALNKEIDQYSTDPAVIQQIEKDFQDVVRDFSGDPDLELFKIKYETLYNSLKEGYENEVRWSRKCKEHNSEIVLYTSKVQMSQKMINDDTQQAEVFQKELEDKWRKTEELKIKEKELRDKIFLGKEEIKNVYYIIQFQLNKQCERVVDDIEELNQEISKIEMEIAKITSLANNEENKEALKLVDQAAKELKVAHRIEDQTIKERENISLLRDKKQQEIEEFKIETLTKEMKLRDLLKNEIDAKLKLRTKQTKALKMAEQTEHETDEQIRTYMNDLKKIENQIINYEAVNARIQKQMAQLQREQEKYGIEASQAHAKFYQTVEEVKIKNNQS